MAKRLGRPPAADSEVTRSRIIETAQRHFGEQGYERATNGEIAAELNLTSGSIYHHFGSKAQLYVAACEQARAHMVEGLEAAVAGHDHLPERIAAILGVAAEMHRSQPALAGFLTAAPSEAAHHPELRLAVMAYVNDLSGFLGRIVDDAVAGGEIASEADPESVVRLLQALILGLAEFARAAPIDLMVDVLAQTGSLIDGTLFSPRQPIVRSVGQ
jgi:AcrR family transcriptional regulator